MKLKNYKKIVYVVHCIDTEGPLKESLKATFQRLKQIYNIKLKANKSTLKKLQNGLINLNGLEEAVKQTLDSKIINYNFNWKKINKMLQECMSKKFRDSFRDSSGKGWIYNWHCVDHVDYVKNPRKRILGYHKIFDTYKYFLKKYKSNKDGLYFHYHPHPIKKHANLCATRWLGPTDKIFQILSRRIIDRHWFPSVNRPGFHVCRPDSHWFLEQFIPFDYANLSMKKDKVSEKQIDVSGGRLGDWRRATKSWAPYHPSHEDYQVEGNCKRWIARCLNIGTRYNNLNQNEVNKAFKEADNNKPVILSFANHDFRDIRNDIRNVYEMLSIAKKKFKRVKFIYQNGVNAMRKSLQIKKNSKFKLNIKIFKKTNDTHVMEVSASKKIFGTQPYFTFKTKKNDYHYDNLDFQVPKKKWTYTFNEETFFLKDIKKIGIASNDAAGLTCVAIYDNLRKKQNIFFLNK